MEHDLFDGAICAASDLTARVKADLVAAMKSLAQADSRCRAAEAAGVPLTLGMRHERASCRQLVASLRRLLAGMPTIAGGRHAASA